MNAQRVEPPSGHQGLDFVAVVNQLRGSNVALGVSNVKADVLVELELVFGHRGHGIGQSVDENPVSNEVS